MKFKAEEKLEIVAAAELRSLRRRAFLGYVGALVGVLGVAEASWWAGKVRAMELAMARTQAVAEEQRLDTEMLERAWSQQSENFRFISDFAENLRERDQIRELNIAQAPVPHPTMRNTKRP